MKTAFQKGVPLRHSRPLPKPKSRWMPRKAHREGGRSVMLWLLSDLMRNTCTHYETSQPPQAQGTQLHTKRLKEKLWPLAVSLCL